MAWQRRVFRIARTMTVGIGVFLLLLFATIQGEQHLQRSRAEHMLRQLQAVDLRVTPFSDVQRVFGQSAAKSTKCDSASCDYSIQLESPIGWQSLFRISDRLHIPSEPVFHALLRLGGRPALVDAKIAVRNG